VDHVLDGDLDDRVGEQVQPGELVFVEDWVAQDREVLDAFPVVQEVFVLAEVRVELDYAVTGWVF
jgi:hypothetical protein